MFEFENYAECWDWKEKAATLIQCDSFFNTQKHIVNFLFYCRHRGWCSLPLHHQMVGLRQIAGKPAYGLIHPAKTEQKPLRVAALRGFDCFLNHYGTIFSLAYWHYSICLFPLQYSFYSILLRYPFASCINIFARSGSIGFFISPFLIQVATDTPS